MEVQRIFPTTNEDKPLPARSHAVYQAIVQHKKTHDGCAPSIRDLMAATGITSTSVVNWHLHRLERAGLIQLDGGSRSIRVVGGRWSAAEATN